MKITLKTLKEMQEMHVSVIGTGRIAWQLESDSLRDKPATHMGALLELQKKGARFQWDYLVDLDEEKAKEAAAFLGSKANPQISRDYHNALEKSPDILVISTTTGEHHSILADAMQANIPLIVVEKPIALNQDEISDLREKEKHSASRIWVNYERRFSHKYSTLKKELDANIYGQVLFYRGLLLSPGGSLYKNEKNEGILLRDTTHLLDLAMYFFGQVESWDHHSAGGHSNLHIIHSSGGTGEITTVSNSPNFHFEMQIITERGRITVGNGFSFFEASQVSKYYKGFHSFAVPEKVPVKKNKLRRNPFIRMYLKVINGSAGVDALQDALSNAELLSSLSTEHSEEK